MYGKKLCKRYGYVDDVTALSDKLTTVHIDCKQRGSVVSGECWPA